MTHQDSNKHQYPENEQYYQTKSNLFQNYEPSPNQTQNGMEIQKLSLKTLVQNVAYRASAQA